MKRDIILWKLDVVGYNISKYHVKTPSVSTEVNFFEVGQKSVGRNCGQHSWVRFSLGISEQAQFFFFNFLFFKVFVRVYMVSISNEEDASHGHIIDNVPTGGLPLAAMWEERFGVLLWQPWASFCCSLKVSIWCTFWVFLCWKKSGTSSTTALVRKLIGYPIYPSNFDVERFFLQTWLGITFYCPFHFLTVGYGVFYLRTFDKTVRGCVEVLRVYII